MKIYFIVFTSLLITACSNRTIYETIQNDNRNTCQKLPPAQYEECISQTEMTYDEYKRERKETLKK